MKTSNKYACTICNTVSDEIFMVKDSLWKSIAKEKQIICWDCFEKLLGRELTADDLKPNTPCNKIYIRLLTKLKDKE